MYVITGATGNIGSKITARLLSQGKPVRLIGRSEDKLNSLTNGQGEKYMGSLEDVEFLTRAFTGATAVFAMIPPDMGAQDFREYQRKVGKAITTAVKNSGVKNVVSLSSVGAHLTENSGVVQGLHDFEQMLNELPDTNVVHLRPTYFMENLFETIESIKKYNMIGTSIKADKPFAIVATEDIAEMATQKMLNLDFSGKSVEYVLGPKDMTYTEITQIIGEKLGKPDLNYMEVSYDDTYSFLTGMGLSESLSKGLVDLSRGMNDGTILEDYQRNERNSTPTTLEKFAETFEKVYNS